MDFNNTIKYGLYILITLASIQVSHISSGPIERQEVGAPGHIGRPNPAEPYTDLSIDQIISGVLEKHKSGDGPQKLLDPSFKYLSELDMVLTEEQYEKLYPGKEAPAPPGKLRTKRKAVNDDILYWDNATVTYELNYDDFSRQDQYVLRTAMNDWEFFTCVNFKAKTKKDRDFIRFQNGFGCNSRLGMVGGMQAVNLESPGCRWKGLYLHEIGHAFGLYHEHQLPQRDDYIYIIWENVAEDLKQWFKKYDKSVVDNFGAAYEYSSVMHYGTSAFSKDGTSQTIKAFDESKEAEIGRVYLKGLSFTDIKVVNNMYQCASHCPNKHCGGAGFMNKDCKCVCPVGDSKCKGIEVFDTEAYISKEDKAKCRNVHYNDVECDYWASDGECKNNPIWMGNNCAKSCKICQPAPEDIPKKTIDNDCGNIESDTDCHYWVKEGNCIRFRKWMAKNCRAACNKCNATEEEEEEEEEGCGNIYDDDKCIGWAEEGECDANPDWMIDNCQNACGKCEEEDKKTDGECINIHNDHECNRWADGGECDANPVWMHENCRLACNLCKLKNTSTDGECPNIHNDHECNRWADGGECDANPVWMHENCRLACNLCKLKNTSTDGECHNIHNDHECNRWADGGECDANPVWMHENCRLACNLCKMKNTSTDGECPNIHNDHECNRWADGGECDANPAWMHENCRLACNLCKLKNTSTDGECPNIHNDHECNRWADGGECDANPVWMHENCRLACNLCKLKNKNTNGECINIHNDHECNRWADGGECDANPVWMHENCRLACNLCKLNKTDSTCVNIFDDEDCDDWFNKGQCDKNKDWMHTNCKRSCKQCETDDSSGEAECVNIYEDDAKCERWAKAGECKENEDWMIENCRRACTKCDKEQKDKSDEEEDDNNVDDNGEDGCRDYYPREKCKQWANDDACVNDKDWMETNCKWTCDKCKTVEEKPKKKGEECLDKNDLCSMWATEGQCTFNPDYMKINCQLSCGICKRKGDDKNKKEEVCQDENSLCSDWAAADHCSISPTYMLVYCKKSCGICIEDGVDAGSGNCKDKNALCKAWTKAGHCDINPSYMHIHCAYSCGKCKPVKKNKNDENETTRDLTDDTPRVKVTTTDLGDEPSKDTSRKTRHGKNKSRRTKSSRDGKRRRKNKDKKTSRTKVNDEDKKSKEPCRDFVQSCEEWARHGHCHMNTKYMLQHCKKSCGRC
ncbi:unnamed protein product [Owenia fusiformis]|uniref:Metalloendopeptidase n=1 Tax=Owenia fusiformis TaxID=6347 RepID=A0A8S4NPP0_OWEFU|nr:unnamed protein product [Owenia fusiformis]